MPVLGHAFVGLATGMSCRPTGRSALGRAVWIPLVVGLSYLPDIAAQLASLAGVGEWGRRASHSLLLAPVAAAIITMILRQGARSGSVIRAATVRERFSWVGSSRSPTNPAPAFTDGSGPRHRSTATRVFMVVLFCLWAHDVLDLLHGTDRRPWWPLSERAVGVLWEQMDWGLNGELLLFGSGFALFLLVRGVSLRWRRPDGRARQAPQPASSRRLILLGHVMTTLILLCAAGTHYARGVRERQFDAAEALLARHDYPGALAALDEADRWPSTAKPGRTDYLRAEACLGLGDRARAEEHYIRSCRADPAYFWALADLTVFYATSDAPLDERRRRTAPYVKRLRRDFAGHEGLPGLLQRLERRLAAPVPRPVSTAGA